MGLWRLFLIALGLAKKKVRRARAPRAPRPPPPSRPPPVPPPVVVASSFDRVPSRSLVPFLPAIVRSLSQRSLLVVGLANGGKTTLVNQLKPTKTRDLEVAPTVGFSVERFTLHKCSLTVVDMSGQSKYHDLWECYYKDAQAVVYVVDAASDEAALDESRETLHEMLAHEHLAGRPLLVFANKSDLPNARSAADVAAEVHLTGAACEGRPWHVGACVAVTGEGVDEGIRWLLGKL
jgi:ADP-ribosylation factor-like protein 6